MEVLSKFVSLSIKRGLPFSSLVKNQEEALVVAEVFVACCENQEHPSEKDTANFLSGPGNWLSLDAKELLSLTKEIKKPLSYALALEEVEQKVEKRKAQEKENRKTRALYLEDRNKEKKIDRSQDELFMRRALAQAEKAFRQDEVPIGAVLVDENGKVVSESFNCVEASNDPCGHAEIRTLRDGANTIGSQRLHNCTLYVTVEPCAMCAGAAINAKIRRLVYGIDEPKTGAVSTNVNLFSLIPGAQKISVTKGVLADESSDLIKRFFENKRKTSR